VEVDVVTLDIDEREIMLDGERFETGQLPPFMQDMLSSGGLVPWDRDRLEEQ
jgi:hypothetical protein